MANCLNTPWQGSKNSGGRKSPMKGTDVQRWICKQLWHGDQIQCWYVNIVLLCYHSTVTAIKPQWWRCASLCDSSVVQTGVLWKKKRETYNKQEWCEWLCFHEHAVASTHIFRHMRQSSFHGLCSSTVWSVKTISLTKAQMPKPWP